MAGFFNWNSKFISKSSFPLKICLGTQNSPVNRLVLFNVISSKHHMLHLLRKLKVYTKLDPEWVHRAPISIQIKIYLGSLVDYQHLQKYSYNWNINITLNCAVNKYTNRTKLL